MSSDPSTYASVSLATAPPPPPLCPWCGYDLCGLANPTLPASETPRTCPECGGDISAAGFALAKKRWRTRQRHLRVVMLITSFAAYVILLVLSIANDRAPNAHWILATAIPTLAVLIPTAFAFVSRDLPPPSTRPSPRSKSTTPLPLWQRGILACAIAALYLIASAGLTLTGLVLSFIISGLL